MNPASLPPGLPKGAIAVDLDPEVDAATTCALLGIELEDLLAELAYRQRVKGEKMAKRMIDAQRAGGVRRTLAATEDSSEGRVAMMIDPISYHYWGNRLGYECWDDDQGKQSFVQQYLRDNATSRVKTVTKTRGVGFGAGPRPKGLVDGKPISREDRLTIKV